MVHVGDGHLRLSVRSWCRPRSDDTPEGGGTEREIERERERDGSFMAAAMNHEIHRWNSLLGKRRYERRGNETKKKPRHEDTEDRYKTDRESRKTYFCVKKKKKKGKESNRSPVSR